MNRSRGYCVGSIPGLGRVPEWGHGSPLQYSCLENPHGQRSLVGNSLWDHKELDTTKWLSTYIHTHTHPNMFHRLWNFKMYSFLMALGLCCCVQAFSSCSKQGLLSCGAQASYCNGFSCCQAWALGCMGFSSYSIWTQFLCSMWYLLGPGIEPMSPAMAGGPSTSGPPGKSKKSFIMQL